jgi:hypothetical protein
MSVPPDSGMIGYQGTIFFCSRGQRQNDSELRQAEKFPQKQNQHKRHPK